MGNQFQYFEKITALLSKVAEEEKDNILAASEKIAEAIDQKKSIYIFGASHAGILAQELFYRAGGLIPINPIFGSEIMLDVEPVSKTSKMERLEGYGTILADSVNFKNGDILILHSVSGRNPVTIDLAIEARACGVYIITITNIDYSCTVSSRHSSGNRLFEVSDLVIDNHGDIGDALCSIKGVEQKVAASSTVVGATILNAIVVETCDILVNQKETKIPPIFYSANIDGGDEINQLLIEEYKETIHYKF